MCIDCTILGTQLESFGEPNRPSSLYNLHPFVGLSRECIRRRMYCTKFRFVVVTFIFTSSMTSYLGRYNLSLAIVHMTLPLNETIVATVTAQNSTTTTLYSDVCPVNSSAPILHHSANGHEALANMHPPSPTAPQGDRRFQWSQTERGTILSAFFCGYGIMQIPAGRMSERFGPRIPWSMAVIGTGLLTLAEPLCANYYVWLFVVCRVLMGMMQSPVMSGSIGLIARWIPQKERRLVLYSVSVTN